MPVKLYRIVYRKIAVRMLTMNITRRELADRLGISDGTLYNKLCRVTPFTLDEAIKVKEILGMPGTLEAAFERFDVNPGD